MNETLYNAVMSGQIDTTALTMKIQEALNTCAQAGFICTTPDNINKFALIVGGLGIVIGIVACLGFQYFKRKTDAALKAREEYESLKKGP